MEIARHRERVRTSYKFEAHKRRAAGVEIQGTFDAQRFFDTLALILSRRENVKITVTVTQEAEEGKQQQKQAV